jgi:hypothetical protein
MACAGPPFVGGAGRYRRHAHLHAAPPYPQDLAPDMPAGPLALIATMLAKHPDARPQTMTTVRPDARRDPVHSRRLAGARSVAGGLADVVCRALANAVSCALTDAVAGVLASAVSGVQRCFPCLADALPRSDAGARAAVLADAPRLGGDVQHPPPAGTRRLLFVLGGLVIAGAVVATAKARSFWKRPSLAM